jgi:N-acetylglucosamine kinase-like BadF-type ATPase
LAAVQAARAKKMEKTALIGLDGGGTKTLGRLALAGAEGPEKALASGRVGATNPHATPFGQIRERLAELRDLLAEKLPGDSRVGAVCLGAAGVDRHEEKRDFEALLAELYPGARVMAVNDAVAALAGAVGRLEGIVAISGTGSIALGARGHDRIERSGGWGHILGDEGGGYQIGLDGARAVCRAWDGRDPDGTSLSGLILSELGLDAPADLIGWINRPETGKSEVAALSKLVFAAAERGDQSSLHIVEKHAELLAELVMAVRRKLGYGPREKTPLVLWGGNLERSELYRRLALEALGVEDADFPFAVVQPRGDACDGALRLAWDAWKSGGEDSVSGAGHDR